MDKTIISFTLQHFWSYASQAGYEVTAPVKRGCFSQVLDPLETGVTPVTELYILPLDGAPRVITGSAHPGDPMSICPTDFVRVVSEALGIALTAKPPCEHSRHRRRPQQRQHGSYPHTRPAQLGAH